VSYLITKNGLVECPVKNCVGQKHGNYGITDAVGYMKFSPNGNYLATTVYDAASTFSFELFGFNNQSGELNLKNKAYLFIPYGLEFSPDSKLLYVIERNGNVSQFDVESVDISSSKRTITSATKDILKAAQIGSNGK